MRRRRPSRGGRRRWSVTLVLTNTFYRRFKQTDAKSTSRERPKIRLLDRRHRGFINSRKKHPVQMPNPSLRRESLGQPLRGTKKVRERARDSAISRRAETAAHARERDVDRPRV
jgi:hypothetical protein